MLILIPVFFALFSAWMLWGWVVGESRNIRWLKYCCAPTFVLTAIVISAGAGAVLTRVITKRQVRGDMQTFISNVEYALEAGRAHDLLAELQKTDDEDDPDYSSGDVLVRIAALNRNLTPQVAEANDKIDGERSMQ